MNKYIPLMLGLWLTGCIGSNVDSSNLEKRIDSLQKQVDHAYRPGFGEFMSGIQVHHAKLWFAGQGKNWDLAKFEIDEIKEAIAGIKSYCTDREETKSISMIEGPLDSLGQTIEKKDSKEFDKRFQWVTITCNNCHQTTHHQFNVIQTPTAPPFSNQIFSVGR